MSSVKKLARIVIPKTAIKQVEKTYRKQKALLANTIYRFPAKKMKVIAVTGTNGKTTTCAYINEVLKQSGLKTALYTTAFIEVSGQSEANKTHMTLASAWAVQKFFAKAKAAKVDWVILEVTSHALDQYRTLGVPVELALVTNLSQDHLDYHGTMESYATAKARLLTEYNPQKVILNADDDWYDFFATKVKKGKIDVGKLNANYQIKGIKLTPNGTSFRLVSSKIAVNLKTKLLGEFNVYNASMAAALAAEIGIEPGFIVAGIEKVPVVPGRMEVVDGRQPFTVLVDFAVTPDALKVVLTSLQEVAKGKVSIVFGATGDRDKAKRPIMGEVVAKYADNIYLTDDETYTEDGDLIRQAVKEGIVKAKGAHKCREIADRKEAIKQAFLDAKAGDVVVLAGIGHEDYRNMGGKKVPWDERVIAKEVLKEVGY